MSKPHRLWVCVALAAFLGSALLWSDRPRLAVAQPGPAATKLPRLVVSVDGRSIEGANGSSFFWLGDTAWNMLHRSTQAEVETYLTARKAQGFTVFMTNVISFDDRPTTGEGCQVMLNRDPLQLTACYLAHVDFVVERAAELGLYVVLLPTWGEKVSTQWGSAQVLFTPQNARPYGRLLGERYSDATNVAWALGGDSPVLTSTEQTIWEELAAGIVEGVATAGADPLIFYHPPAFWRQSTYFHSNPNFDLNAWQSGHSAPDISVWNDISSDYALVPTKPVFDSEPAYEDHPINWGLVPGHFRDYEVRRQIYRGLFAGGFGATYGNHSVWQWYAPGWKSVWSPERYWYEALDRPGATQLIHLRRLIESRPLEGRIPDQGLLASAAGTGINHVRATRDSAGSYAMVYIPTAQTVSVNLDRLTGDLAAVWWYDPRTGAATAVGSFPSAGSRSFKTPEGGPDWVLVLDDASRITNAPGEVLPSPSNPEPDPDPDPEPSRLPPASYIPQLVR